MAFYNQAIKQKDLGSIVDECFRELGQSQAIELLERITQFGVRKLTRSGCSIAVSNLNYSRRQSHCDCGCGEANSNTQSQLSRGLIGAN